MESKDIANLNIKIIDFGFAKFCDPTEDGLTETVGSPVYMAPEIIKKLPYGCSVDIWALGVLLYTMLSGTPPFRGKTKEALFEDITTRNASCGGTAWKAISAAAEKFVKAMLSRDPKRRPTAEDLLQKEWITKNVDKTEIAEEFRLDIAQSLQSFRKNSVF